MKFRSVIIALTLAALGSPAAFAGSLSEQNLSTPSEQISVGSGLVVYGVLNTVAGSGRMVVTGIQAVGESTIIVLKGVSDGAEVSITVASGAAGELSVGVGTSVVIVADATGHALMTSGRMLAYIPNELGRSLIHQTKVRQGRS